MRSLLKNKRGDFTGVLYLIASVTALAIFLTIVGYLAITITPAIKNQINDSRAEINESLDATLSVATNTLSVVWLFIFGGLMLGLIVTSWNIPSRPVFVPIFIIVLVVAVILGSALSDAYTEVYSVTEFSSVSATQEVIYFLMSNLEYTALVLGLMSLVITFAKPGDSGGFGGGAPPM